MSSLQTTPSSTDTAPERIVPVFYGQQARQTFAEMFRANSPEDQRRSTKTEAADFWRRLSVSDSPDVPTLDYTSNEDIRCLLQPAFYNFVWTPEQVQAAVTSIESLPTADLRASLCDLDNAVEEAAEEGFPEPSRLALTSARSLLQDLYRLRPSRLEVYPTPDGEIAVVVPGGHGRSVLVLCDSQGGALCSVNLNGCHRRARYDTATMLPDGFVRDAIAELDELD